MKRYILILICLFMFLITLYSASAVDQMEFFHLKFNNNINDDGNITQVWTDTGGVVFNATNKKVGTHSVEFYASENKKVNTSSIPNLNMNNTGAIMFWFYWKSDTGPIVPVSNKVVTAYRLSYILSNTGTDDVWYDQTCGASDNYNLGTGKWYHIGMNWSGNKHTYWLNGSTYGSPDTGCSGYNVLDYIIGSDSFGNDLNGLVDDFRLYNGIQLNASDWALIYNNGTGTEQELCALQGTCGAPASPSNFTITANETYWNGSITTFSALIDGTAWFHTTTGLINTTYLSNDTITHNITLNATGYLNQTYLNWNVSTTLPANLTRNYTIMNFTAHDWMWNSAISTFTVTASSINSSDSHIVSTTNGNVSLNLSWNETYTVIINASSYFNYSGSHIADSLFKTVQANLTINHSKINVTAWNIFNQQITHFTVTADSYNSSASFSGSTTTGVVSLNLSWNETYNISLDAVNHSTLNAFKNHTASTNYSIVNFTGIYRTNSINITFRDEVSGALVYNVSLELISDVYAANFTTNPNATFYIDLLSPEEYIIRYYKAGYSERFYIFNLQNRSYTELTLYLINASLITNVTATVVQAEDQYNKIENAYIKVLKYDIATNSYIIQEIAKTNFEGQAVLHLVLNEEFYKFIIEYPLGTVKKTTTPSYIFSSSIEFAIPLDVSVLEDYYNFNDVSYSFVFNNDTNNFRFTYSDANNIVTSGCVEVFAFEDFEFTAYNSSCGTGAAGSVLVGVLNSSNTTYRADSYICYTGGECYFIESLWYSFEEVNFTGGKLGLFIAIIFIITFTFLGIWWKSLMLILAPVPLFFLSILNVIDIGIGWCVLIELIAFILAIIISNKRLS